MNKGRTAPPPREARILAFGMLLGLGEEEYLPHEIARIVNARFGLKLKSKTISNWKSVLPAQMKRYGITEQECREAVVRVLTGDVRPREEIEELKPYTVKQGHQESPQETLRAPVDASGRDGKEAREPVDALGRAGEEAREPVDALGRAGEEAREPEVPPVGLLKFSTVAEVVAYIEGQGFMIGKNEADIITQLEAKNLSVIRNADKMVGVEEIFITPLELDMEVVGRNIVANPIIQFYFAIARKLHSTTASETDKDLDITEWITACVLDVYNNMDPPIKLAVLYG